jgi:hypothetical protein
MKITLPQLLGWAWITIVLYLYIAQNVTRLRPPGQLGDILKAFFESMTASYLY